MQSFCLSCSNAEQHVDEDKNDHHNWSSNEKPMNYHSDKDEIQNYRDEVLDSCVHHGRDARIHCNIRK